MSNHLKTISLLLSGAEIEEQYFYEFEFPSDDFSLHHDTLGLIKLPLTPAPIKKLIEQAELAPFGLREDTLIDASVRDSWQIEAEHLEFQSGWFHDKLPIILNQVKEKIGVWQG